jgi:hypothetical protein
MTARIAKVRRDDRYLPNVTCLHDENISGLEMDPWMLVVPLA